MKRVVTTADRVQNQAGPNRAAPNPGANRAPNWTTPKSTASAQPRQSWSRLFPALRISLAIATGFCIYLNMQPYISLVEAMLTETVSDGLISLLLKLPILGQFLSFIGSAITSIIGFFIWSIFQILEIFPMLLLNDPNTISKLIRGIENTPFISLKESDTPFLRRLKEKHNTLPTTWIRNALRLGAIAYFIDLFVVCLHFPPLKGGMETLGLFLLAPTVADIDWRNALYVVITLFAVEAIVALWLWLNNVNRHFGQA